MLQELHDGAAAVLLLMSEEKAKIKDLPPGNHPELWVMRSPPELMAWSIVASKKPYIKPALTSDKLEPYKLNEAFASQSIAVRRNWASHPDKVNVNAAPIASAPIGVKRQRILVNYAVNKKRKAHMDLQLSVCGEVRYCHGGKEVDNMGKKGVWKVKSPCHGGSRGIGQAIALRRQKKCRCCN